MVDMLCTFDEAVGADAGAVVRVNAAVHRVFYAL
jgi:hypothetical protein